MPLISVNIPEHLSHSITGILERIAIALERIAGPVIEYRPPEQATLRDYAYVDPAQAERIREAENEFAAAHLVIPGSPAYLSAIEEFERQVANAYGDGAVEELPWRKVMREVPRVESTPHPES